MWKWLGDDSVGKTLAGPSRGPESGSNPDVEAWTCNSNTREAKIGEFLQLQDQ